MAVSPSFTVHGGQHDTKYIWHSSSYCMRHSWLTQFILFCLEQPVTCLVPRVWCMCSSQLLFLKTDRVCSSHLYLSSKYVFFLCHLYPASSRNSFCFVCLVCFVVIISEVAFFVCCVLVPGTLASFQLDLPTLIHSRFLFFFSDSPSVTTSFASV